MSLIPAQLHISVEIDHEVSPSVVLLLPLMHEALLSVTSQRSLIPVRLHTSVEIDHEICSLVILFLPLIYEALLSVASKSMNTEYLLTA